MAAPIKILVSRKPTRLHRLLTWSLSWHGVLTIGILITVFTILLSAGDVILLNLLVIFEVVKDRFHRVLMPKLIDLINRTRPRF